MKIDVAAITDTGRVREANEDSFLVDLDLFIFAVADGMGGHVAGEIASATAVEAVRASIANGADIETAIRIAHSAVRKKAASEEALSGMGTTMTALGFSKDKKLVVAHVGDSRAYVIHRQLSDEPTTDEQTQLVRITKDHSLVEELVDAGQITEEEANVHPRRSVITRALGISGEVEVDTNPIAFLKGDRYLLCSDGLTSMIRDDQIAEILNSDRSPNQCATELISRANKAGGNDNITVLVLDVLDPDIKAPVTMLAAQSIAADESHIQSLHKKGRIGFALRVLAGLILVGALLFGAFSTAKHFAHQGYFLDQKNGEIVLMSGKYGGVLWWHPELDSQTGIEIKNLSSADKLLVKRHETFTSRKDALSKLEKIRARQKQDRLDETPTSDETTTTSTNPINTVPITISQGTHVSAGQ